MKSLTRAEEQVMQALWKLEKAFLRDVVEAMPPPRPHQNTIATLLKILTEKDFVAVTVLGRQHEYRPRVSKQEYSRKTIKQLMKGYFEGSFSNVVSFMVREKNISVEELEKLLQQIRKQQNQKK